ncbi:MAG: GNAT family N-acetyltransferase [Candidatus Riflebacteria bacterium]|nr:GNAT family N-acetyltransferase [Candidatus Riflebacteria bacterium]
MTTKNEENKPAKRGGVVNLGEVPRATKNEDYKSVVEKNFLSSARVGFRKWTSKDLKFAFTLWQDSEVTKYIGGPFDENEIRLKIEREIACEEAYNMQYWPVFSIENGEFLGCGGLRPYKIENKIYEIGIHLMKNCWGKGYGNEIAQCVIQYGFSVLNASAIFAGHNPKNEASRGMLTKLRFKYSHDEFYAPTGLMHPSYFLLKSDWLTYSSEKT